MNIHFDSNLANPKVRRQKFGVGSLIFLLLFGAIFTGVGLWGVKGSQIDSSWPRVSGEIISSSSSISDGRTIYTPVVKYQVNGTEYQVTGSSGSSFAPHMDDRKEVAYNPASPQEAKVVEGKGTQAFLYLFPAVGIICLILAPILFVRSLRRGTNIRQLMESGQKLQGVLVDIESSGTTNDHPTYKIVVAATDTTGQVQNYTSDSLTGIGGLATADFRNNPIPIDVYVNPGNPKEYYVDVSDIPNLTPDRIAELIKSATAKRTFTQSEQPNPAATAVAPGAAPYQAGPAVPSEPEDKTRL